MRPSLPRPRGPLSGLLLQHLVEEPGRLPPPEVPSDDVLADDDLQLALYCCYELHYQGFAGVDDRWEWEPSLLGWRRELELATERSLFERLGPIRDAEAEDVEGAIRRSIDAHQGPSLSGFMLGQGTLQHLQEFAIHRSAYQLKEADPHTWGIPRLLGAPKAAMVEVQMDEYGGGVESEMHATLFGVTMDELGLNSTYGAYLDLLPGPTLATTNLVSLFGLHRRWIGALVGHLAVFETTSVVPMGRYADALSRLGVDSRARRFYDVHVDADAHHEVVACTDLAGGLARSEPSLAGDIVFGARALLLVEGCFTQHLMDAWASGRSSLRLPLPARHLLDIAPP